MATFIALYRGESIAAAKLLAVSADPGLVVSVATSLLARGCEAEGEDGSHDPAILSIEAGRRKAGVLSDQFTASWELRFRKRDLSSRSRS